MVVNDILIAILMIVSIVAILCLALVFKNLADTLQSLKTVLNETKETVTVITQDVHDIALETKSILNDVNHKLEKIDPLFSATGEVGETISKTNKLVVNTAVSIDKKRKRTRSSFSNLTKNVFNLVKKIKK